LAVLDRLSFKSGCGLARSLADLWWIADVARRRVAESNILQSGIESDPRRARALGRLSVQHVGLVVVEALKSDDLLEGERWLDHIRLEVSPDVMEVLEDPDQGLIIASGHFGSWEIAAHLLSRWKPVAGITRAMDNPRAEELIQSRKARYRFHPIPKYDADAGRFVSVLQEGEILALLVDQHAHSGGMDVEFFGRPAATHTTAAMLHLVTRTPLCFAACRRVAPARFELKTSELIRHDPSGDRKGDVHGILATLNGHLETAIREAPDQYLWGHRRWRD
jgi:KDO2-lipid IV(A) lauroyltransferase